jgi:hypothetical protein
VISGFGIALATTIAGLALRVTLQQLREDPFEIEQEVRQTLNQEVLRLEREVRLSVEAMVLLRNRTSEETRLAVGSGLAAILKDGREAMVVQTETFKSTIEAMLTGVKEATLAAKVQLADSRKSSLRLVKAVEALAQKIEETKAPTAGLREMIDHFTQTLDQMIRREADRIETNRQSAAAILAVYKEMETRALEAAASMETCKTAATSMHQSVVHSSEAATAMTERVLALTDDLLLRSGKHVDLLHRVEQMSSQNEELLRTLRTSLQSEVQQSAGALAALERNVVQASELIVRQLSAQ